MRTIGRPIQIRDIEDGNGTLVDSWFDSANLRFKVLSGAVNPTVAMIPNGEWIVFKNTALNEIRVWTNDNGTMKKGAAFT